MFAITYTSKSGITYYFDSTGKSFSRKESAATTYNTREDANRTLQRLSEINLAKAHCNKDYQIVDLSPAKKKPDLSIPELDDVYKALCIIHQFLQCKNKLTEIRNSMDLEQNSVLHSLENTDYTEEQYIEIFHAFKVFRKRRRQIKDLLAILNILQCQDVITKSLNEIEHIKNRKPEDFSGYDRDVEKFLSIYAKKENTVLYL